MIDKTPLQLKELIKPAFDGNKCNNQMGRLEELEETVNLLVDGLSSAIVLLLGAEVISIDDLINFLNEGWGITL